VLADIQRLAARRRYPGWSSCRQPTSPTWLARASCPRYAGCRWRVSHWNRTAIMAEWAVPA